eukprot:scaffold34558_cov12-Tisochrysis_lutea.AAC.1
MEHTLYHLASRQFCQAICHPDGALRSASQGLACKLKWLKVILRCKCMSVSREHELGLAD